MFAWHKCYVKNGIVNQVQILNEILRLLWISNPKKDMDLSPLP